VKVQVNQTACENIDYNVLVVDDDSRLASVLLRTLAGRDIRGTVATDRKTAAEYLRQKIWSMVLVSYKFAYNPRQTNPFELLRTIKTGNPELPVIMISDSGSAQNVLNAVRAGFSEVLIKPVTEAGVNNIIDTFLPNHQTDSIAKAGPYNIIGQSNALKETTDLAIKVAPTSAPVLITGQSGTGKELIAQLIHNESQRAIGPFVKINCAALSDSLLESELFGHEKGAFTGAAGLHKGKFERAHGGTLLLDEITETGQKFQAQLLRVLEQMDFERVGGSESINVNVRVISTTNTDILEMVNSGAFRSDLYYRLSAIRLIVPPLCERPEDLPPLIWHFVNLFAHETKRPISSIDPVMLDIFEKYHWPGNIRQLRNVLRAALILGSGPRLSLEDASWLIDELQPACREDGLEFSRLAGTRLQELEQHAIVATLEKTGGNQRIAAQSLGISDRTLRDKIKKYRQQGSMVPA